MSLFSRIVNVFRRDRVTREIDEEMQSHIDEALEHGRDPEQVRRAFGSKLRTREESRDVKLTSWLESLRADAVFGWRQLAKNRITSGAAILSLALAVGACTSAFRLIDAALLRPLPVQEPERLRFLSYEFVDNAGKRDRGDSFEYPLFRELRETVKSDAELLAISYAVRDDLTFGSDADMEKAYRQFVSGQLFNSFGLRPALGRLLTPADDVKPGAHPYAVLSYDYWQRRFGRDPKAVGRTFRIGGTTYEIVGVVQKGFTGTETGTMTDVFIPTMMNSRAINEPNWSWFRTWVRLNHVDQADQVRERLRARMREYRRERAKQWAGEVPPERLAEYVEAPLFLEPAAAGVSGMQRDYRKSLTILGVLVALVLLIACANVANLLTAQASARAREMALRVSIGAGRSRLIQLMLVESAWIAFLATLIGGLFAWWSAPFVVGMINPAHNPIRLVLPADWRVLGFAAVLAAGVTILFGLTPALRASAVQPVSALKGGSDLHSRQRLMNVMVAAQVAFCFLVHFVSGLFVATFDRLSNQPLGFSAERILTLEAGSSAGQHPSKWIEVADHLRTVPGVESVAIAGWALMSGNGWSSDVRIGGRPPERDNPYFLAIAPGWLDTMRVQLIDGRDFRADDAAPDVAIVNEAFSRRYFNGENPTGKSFERMVKNKLVPTRIVGYVRDARYRNMREPIRPTVYVPHRDLAKQEERWATYIVKTASSDPTALAATLRIEVPRVRPEIRVSNIRTQTELIEQHTVRERLLATLSLFFAGVALILAAVGLYGVLSYSVLQRRREIGIRMALGAQTKDVAGRLATEVFAMLAVGAISGLTLGISSERYLETLLYQVKATNTTMLVIPLVTILTVAFFAALPPLFQATRIDPAVTLRSE